jgi:hypothetical protein
VAPVVSGSIGEALQQEEEKGKLIRASIAEENTMGRCSPRRGRR